MSTDPKQFWENKILGWEHGRYGRQTDEPSLLEVLANKSGGSLRYRQNITLELLKPFIEGKRVVEVGCGSGLLAKDIIAMGAESYLGYDIAEAAINRARERADDSGIADQVTFEARPVCELPLLDTDIVFSTGLLDWLTEDDLAALFKAIGSADYLHSIAEKRFSLAQFVHRLYVHIAYGRKTGSYVPRYYSVADLEPLIHLHNPAPVEVFRHPKLSFGALISSLDIGER